MPSTAEATPLMKPEPNAVGSAVSSASRLNGAGSSRGSATAGRHLASLTRREREVFERVVIGMLNKQIAAQLRITEKTVKAHRARVMRKMRVRSVAELARMAEKLGTKAV